MPLTPLLPRIAYETHVSEPILAAGRQLVVQSRALRLELPPFGGLIWNRPSAVRVRDAGGERVLPVHDLTRLMQLALFGGAALALFCLGLSRRARR
ncbi:MAG: hypothetical protein HZB53_15455 [Chloroflexi bacterium]|nr:hypothetical protein [Chloroflexota bacterium]